MEGVIYMVIRKPCLLWTCAPPIFMYPGLKYQYQNIYCTRDRSSSSEGRYRKYEWSEYVKYVLSLRVI